jgi:SpoU rRNA methylase family enzyme
MRILLCEQRPAEQPSLLLDIIQHHVLTAAGASSFTILTPVVGIEDLDEAIPAQSPDVILVLGNTLGLERARNVARAHGSVEVVAITRTGYVMFDLDPARLPAMLRAVVSDSKGNGSHPVTLIK